MKPQGATSANDGDAFPQDSPDSAVDRRQNQQRIGTPVPVRRAAPERGQRDWSVGTPIRRQAAQPREENQTCQHHRQGINRLSKKDRELLHHAHFRQHKSEANADEVEDGAAGAGAKPSRKGVHRRAGQTMVRTTRIKAAGVKNAKCRSGRSTFQSTPGIRRIPEWREAHEAEEVRGRIGGRRKIKIIGRTQRRQTRERPRLQHGLPTAAFPVPRRADRESGNSNPWRWCESYPNPGE